MLSSYHLQKQGEDRHFHLTVKETRKIKENRKTNTALTTYTSKSCSRHVFVSAMTKPIIIFRNLFWGQSHLRGVPIFHVGYSSLLIYAVKLIWNNLGSFFDGNALCNAFNHFQG